MKGTKDGIAGGMKLRVVSLFKMAHNGLWLCVRWGFPALKPIDSTKFNLSTNDYR